MPTLYIASGSNEGRWFPIGKKSLLIGRDEGLIGQITDAGISRKHMSIAYDDETGTYSVVDLRSKNGVFLNNQRVKGHAPLRDDDLIRVGDTLLLFTMQDFDDDHNALNFFRKRGEHVKETMKLQGAAAADMQSALKQLEQRERDAKKHP